MQNEKNEEIKQAILEYEANIDSYWSSLNDNGVWLFLATLGCWSVNHIVIQICAIIITFILFTHRIYSKHQNMTPLYTMRITLEDKIKNTLEDSDAQKARLYDVQQIKDKKLSTTNTFKSTAIFSICYSFLAVTFWHWFNLAGFI